MEINDRVAKTVKLFGNELAMYLTPSNEAMKAVRFAREALTDILTTHEREVREKESNKRYNLECQIEAVVDKYYKYGKGTKNTIKQPSVNKVLNEIIKIITTEYDARNKV